VGATCLKLQHNALRGPVRRRLTAVEECGPFQVPDQRAHPKAGMVTQKLRMPAMLKALAAL